MAMIFYKEKLDEAEFDFLHKRWKQNHQAFKKVMGIFIFVGFMIPFAGGAVMYYVSHYSKEYQETMKHFPNEGNPVVGYVVAIIFIFLLNVVLAIITYYKMLYKLKKDLKHRYKIIEQTEIVNKRYMPQNHTFHFYLQTPTKLSVEVSKEDFEKYQIGDELNIEYSEFAKVFFGYF